MAFINFPSAPVLGQIFTTPEGVEYQWNGVAWLLVPGDQPVVSIIATSTSSVTIGVTTQNFLIEKNKAFTPGEFVMMVFPVNPTSVWMWGQVLTYDPTTGALSVAVQLTSGSGTINSWTLMLSGTRGPQGTQGVQGPTGPTGPSGSPSGAAGGDLTGTYPNPSLRDLRVLTAKIANAAVTPAKIAGGTDGQFLKTVGSSVAWGAGPSVTPTTPGGPANSVQYNSGGAFGGSSGLLFDGTTLNVSNVRTALGGKLMAGPDANYLWSNATYYIWQFDASPSASMYWEAGARMLFLNTVSAGGTIFSGAQTWQSENGFRCQLTPWAWQSTFNVLTAVGTTRTGVTNVVDADALNRIAALQPIAYTHVPSARPPLTLTNVPMREIPVPGPDGLPIMQRVPDYAAFPDPTVEGHRQYLARRRTLRARSFDPDQFATVYPEMVTPQEGSSFKGIGLDMDFYADLVSSIKALKKRVEDLEAMLPPPPPP